ncbi:MAG: DUF2914 domain-containing protein [Candidatus Taylorbacteria bacterium]|nr:DUF2914 domain-containing protein [Candidatus Taylorbacteria bacterium]
MFERTKSFAHKHEKRLSTFAFIFGFVWDNLTLTRVDRLFDNIMLSTYLLVAFVSIVMINAHGASLADAGGQSGESLIATVTGRFRGKLLKQGADFSRFLLPFAFGGLFSGFLIFYSRSGEVLSSAPFLLILLMLFFCNEFLRRHYQRFIFQMSIFFVALFSYVALLVPILFGRIGGLIFVLSGLISLLLFLLALRAVGYFAPEETEKSRYSLYALVTIIFITFNFLYFNNMIPPIPLSVKEIGIYHDIERTRSGSYRLSFEKAPWYALGKRTSAVFRRTSNEPAYAWSSVFAPTRLDTEIVHRWSFYDEAQGEWVSKAVIGFPILGGRSDGYRGYSVKEMLTAGKWRVDVETLRGQIIGRFVFRVEDVMSAPVLKETTL